MAITYTWKVTGIKKTPDGTVVQTYWEKIGTDENGNTAKFSGATPFTRDTSDGATFIPFDNLTEENVLTWIKSVVVGEYANHVNGRIEEELNKHLVTDAALPWAAEEAVTPATSGTAAPPTE